MQKFNLLWVYLLAGALWAQNYEGPIATPTSGYGSWGTSTVDSIEFYNTVDFTGDTSLIFYPQGNFSPLPTVFFLHGVSGNSPVHVRKLLHFIASKGFACVYVPWDNSMPVIQAYSVMYNGFLEAARGFPNVIDTTRVGFAGHSFGGGACFSIAYTLASQGWGTTGMFLMPFAQWYTYAITQQELQSFPSNTYLLSIVYDDDAVCDHRMSIDIFNNISIPATDKDIVLVTSSQYQAYNYDANHVAIHTMQYNAMDSYVTFRLTDAMMDFVFNGNLAAKTVALGDGSSTQVTMPAGLNNLIVSDTLSAWHPESMYGYPCSSGLNPRSAYCGLSMDVAGNNMSRISVFPVPAQLFVQVFGAEGEQYVLNDAFGRIAQTGVFTSDEEVLDISMLSPGVYFLYCDDQILKIVKQ